MKQYFALVLTLVILFKPLWPLAEYVIYYDYIVENLCENTDKPMLNCDGKCYLAKMLAAESKQSHHTDNPFEKPSKIDKDLKVLQLGERLLKPPFLTTSFLSIPHASKIYENPLRLLSSPPPRKHL